MARLMQWLSEGFTGPLPFEFGLPRGVPEKPTRLQVLAALFDIGGGLKGSGYGMTSGGGIYGRRGLQQSEAYFFWDMRAYVLGWLEGTDNAETREFMLAMEAEWARVEATKIPPTGTP